MIRIYPQQLAGQLNVGLHGCYLFCGNDPLLRQESQESLRHAAQQHNFSEYFNITLDAHTDWEAIFSICQSLSLFASRQILSLTFPETGLSALMSQQLIKLVTLLHPDILLILGINKLIKTQENSQWYKALSQNAVLVNCQTPDHTQLPRWIHTRAKKMKLEVDEAAILLLCDCYEGNLLALSQALQTLSLCYPDGKLTLPRVEQAVHNLACFTPYHWLDAVLAGSRQRTWHILKKLQQEEDTPVILLRILQRELLLLTTLKRQMKQTGLTVLFEQYHVWQNRRNVLTQALQRLSIQQIYQAIHLLTKIEIHFKNDHSYSIWPGLETLSMLLCGEVLAESFLNV
ncbi:DNA polymerase III subunit delta [Candidatus Regiella endosymbiont of Tuberolachnus salignus]|uniref:DNA polymerase III subunit delta n=1 Tax=Candidatus Regiella endosymbiont of Tuberolachnus salignus TaxID=3077956 RepID=UPI0030CABD88